MRRHTEPIFEKLVLFLVLVIATGAGLGAYIAKQQGGTGSAYDYNGGNHLIQLVFSSLYLYFFFRIARRRKEALALIKQEKWLAAFWLWALASAAWSVSTPSTAVHWIALLGTGLVGLYIGMRFEPEEQLNLLAGCLAAVALASFIVALAIPGIGVARDGAWQGVFFPKNSLGRMMALGVLTFVFIAIERQGRRWISVVMAVFCAVLLVLSHSATAIIVCAVMLGLLPFRKLLALGNRLFVPLLTFSSVFVVPLVVWLAMNSKAILEILGRDNSLTGRLPLWAIILQEIASRPVFGYGYGAFWSTEEADRVRDTIGWNAPNAHNGFLEILLGLGVVGGALLLMGLLRNLALAVRAARARAQMGESWPLFFLIFNLLYSITESSLLSANFILSMLFVANSYWAVRTRVEGEEAQEEEEASTEDVTAESYSCELVES
jgi:exopolysaccharide production protein ExoQ